MVNHLWILLGTFITLVSCHPLKKDQPEQQQQQPSSTNGVVVEQEEERIQVDLFSQLLSTHWQFDHLDSLMSQSHKEIADHIQNHIEIDIQPQQHSNQQAPSLSSFELSSPSSSSSSSSLHQQPFKKMMIRPSMEHMEYDLLKSQMMNAIQARTQGLLPEMWDQAGDALSRPAIERYVQQLLRSACPLNEEWVVMSCLQHHAIALSSQLDDYVQHHLTTLWTHFQQDALPELLDSTVKELEKVVDYFNEEAFFSASSHPHRIIVNALPWSASSMVLSLSSLDDHSLFSNFLTLAKL